jgi:hypothetical protein
MLIWVISYYRHSEFSGKAHIRLDVKGMNVEAINFVGWKLRLVQIVEKESECKEENSDDDEAAIAATYAL